MESKALGKRVLKKSIDLLYSFEPHRPEQSLFQIGRSLILVQNASLQPDQHKRIYMLL